MEEKGICGKTSAKSVKGLKYLQKTTIYNDPTLKKL